MEVSENISDLEKGKREGMVSALVLIGSSGIISGEQFDKIQEIQKFPPLSLDEEWIIETSSGCNRKEVLHTLVDELQDRDGGKNVETWNRVRREIESDEFVKNNQAS